MPYAFSVPRVKPATECAWDAECRQTADHVVTERVRDPEISKTVTTTKVCRWHATKARAQAATLDYVEMTVRAF